VECVIKPSWTSGRNGGNTSDRESGYSHVVGVLLLITIVMIMGGILSLVLIASPLPGKVPMAYLGISQSDSSVEVYNKAGDTLTSDSITIVVDGVDRTGEFRTQDNNPGWETLKVGEHLSYKSPIKTASVRVV